MEPFKKIIPKIIPIVFLLISCKKDDQLVIHKMNTNRLTQDVYAVENLSVNNKKQIDSISSFVLLNYSKPKADTSKVYSILFYVFDEDGNNGISNKMNFEKDLIEWKAEYLQLEYSWQNGEFLGMSKYEDGELVISYIPVPYFKKHMKVIERTEKTKNGIKHSGNG